MVAGLTVGKKKYAAVEPEMKEAALAASSLVTELTSLAARDAAAYGQVAEAYRMPKVPDDAAAARQAAIDAALLGAAEVPLFTARACARVAELAASVATRGNTNAVSDAGVAALLADAACRGAAYNVRINVAALADRTAGAPYVQEALGLVALTGKHAAEATEAVEKAIG
jgi:glutamate formiminotransferase/formiminotetrahydrofolate cyclodeaminase